MSTKGPPFVWEVQPGAALVALRTWFSLNGLELLDTGELCRNGVYLADVDMHSIRFEEGTLKYDLFPVQPLQYIDIRITI